jgi:hypothetical protein
LPSLVRKLGGFDDVGLLFGESLRDVTPAGQLARLGRPSRQRLADACRATAHHGVRENDMVTYLVKAVGKTPDSAAVFINRENAQLEAY